MLAIFIGAVANIFFYLEAVLTGTVGLILNLVVSIGAAGVMFVIGGKVLGIHSIGDILGRIWRKILRR